MKFGKEIVLLSLFAFAALVAAGAGVDEPFRQHMWVLFFALAGFTAILLRNTEFKPAAPIDPSAYMDGPIRYGAIATMFWGVVG
ncbi:cytochrome-c oxidase, cbb3-type subunit I, partial [Mesorhizobium sp. M1060]